MRRISPIFLVLSVVILLKGGHVVGYASAPGTYPEEEMKDGNDLEVPKNPYQSGWIGYEFYYEKEPKKNDSQGENGKMPDVQSIEEVSTDRESPEDPKDSSYTASGAESRSSITSTPSPSPITASESSNPYSHVALTTTTKKAEKVEVSPSISTRDKTSPTIKITTTNPTTAPTTTTAKPVSIHDPTTYAPPTTISYLTIESDSPESGSDQSAADNLEWLYGGEKNGQEENEDSTDSHHKNTLPPSHDPPPPQPPKNLLTTLIEKKVLPPKPLNFISEGFYNDLGRPSGYGGKDLGAGNKPTSLKWSREGSYDFENQTQELEGLRNQGRAPGTEPRVSNSYNNSGTGPAVPDYGQNVSSTPGTSSRISESQKPSSSSFHSYSNPIDYESPPGTMPRISGASSSITIPKNGQNDYSNPSQNTIVPGTFPRNSELQIPSSNDSIDYITIRDRGNSPESMSRVSNDSRIISSYGQGSSTNYPDIVHNTPGSYNNPTQPPDTMLRILVTPRPNTSSEYIHNYENPPSPSEHYSNPTNYHSTMPTIPQARSYDLNENRKASIPESQGDYSNLTVPGSENNYFKSISFSQNDYKNHSHQPGTEPSVPVYLSTQGPSSGSTEDHSDFNRSNVLSSPRGSGSPSNFQSGSQRDQIKSEAKSFSNDYNNTEGPGAVPDVLEEYTKSQNNGNAPGSEPRTPGAPEPDDRYSVDQSPGPMSSMVSSAPILQSDVLDNGSRQNNHVGKLPYSSKTTNPDDTWNYSNSNNAISPRDPYDHFGTTHHHPTLAPPSSHSNQLTRGNFEEDPEEMDGGYGNNDVNVVPLRSSHSTTTTNTEVRAQISEIDRIAESFENSAREPVEYEQKITSESSKGITVEAGKEIQKHFGRKTRKCCSCCDEKQPVSRNVETKVTPLHAQQAVDPSRQLGERNPIQNYVPLQNTLGGSAYVQQPAAQPPQQTYYHQPFQQYQPQYPQSYPYQQPSCGCLPQPQNCCAPPAPCCLPTIPCCPPIPCCPQPKICCQPTPICLPPPTCCQISFKLPTVPICGRACPSCPCRRRVHKSRRLKRHAISSNCHQCSAAGEPWKTVAHHRDKRSSPGCSSGFSTMQQNSCGTCGASNLRSPRVKRMGCLPCLGRKKRDTEENSHIRVKRMGCLPCLGRKKRSALSSNCSQCNSLGHLFKRYKRSLFGCSPCAPQPPCGCQGRKKRSVTMKIVKRAPEQCDSTCCDYSKCLNRQKKDVLVPFM